MTTTINNEHKKLNVPNLRFPEFQGEWEEYRIEDITENISSGKCKSHSSNGEYNLYGSTGIIGKTDEACYEGNLVLVARVGANAGFLQIINEPCGITDNTLIIKPQKVGAQYIYYYLQHFNLNRLIFGSGQPLITGGMLKKVKVSLGNIQEQNKLTRLLSLLDERIATQNKIIEDLKKLKSAIVEKVFCSPNQEYPMCRIEGFEHALSTYKMSDFSSRIASKNKDSKCSLVLTIAAQYGLVNQESFFNKSVASDNLTGYYLLHKGEFAYNRSYSAGYDWGAVKRLDNYDEGVLSTLYICFKINETIVDSDYLAYYFESSKWHKGLSDIAGEGARNHGLLNVSITDYFNTKHRFPVIEEQKAIAKMLNTITEKERKATLLGECYQKQKQYLLCQMFI